MIYQNIHEVMNDSKFIEYVQSPRNPSPKTQTLLASVLLKYTNIQNLSLKKLINEAKGEERNGVMASDRKIVQRLKNFYIELNNSEFAKSSVQLYITKIKTFYREMGVEIPYMRLPNVEHRQMTYEDIPNQKHIKKALNSTNNKLHKAIIIFQYSSCTALAEMRSITISMFIKACKDYLDDFDEHNMPNIYDVVPKLIRKQKQIQEKGEGIIPLFYLSRIKKSFEYESGYKYYTCATPEAIDYILDYLSERINKKTPVANDDLLFPLKESSVQCMYQRINDKNNWGKVHDYRFFRSHAMRKAGNTAIEDMKFGDAISGRKRDAVHEAYFMRNPEAIRKKYKEFVEVLTLNPTKIIYSEQTSEEVKKLRKGRAEDQQKIAESQQRITDLENQVYRKREMLQDERSRNAERESKINEWFNDALKILLTYNINPEIKNQLQIDLQLKDKIYSNYNTIYNDPVSIQKLQEIVIEVYNHNKEKIQLLNDEMFE